jgi:8-oxo-dGTP pyrophosphatase MutT (NUDIX family)
VNETVLADLGVGSVHQPSAGANENKRHAAIGIVRHQDKKRVLTVTRGESGEQALPGGHVEDGETPQMAVERELREETGLDAVASAYVTRVESPVDGRPVHVFEASGGNDEPRDVEGVGKVAWMTPRELLEQAKQFAPTVQALIDQGHLRMTDSTQMISTERRNDLPEDKFALPKLRKYPIDTAARTRNASARLEQEHKAGKVSDNDYATAKKRIAAAAKKFGIESEYLESDHTPPRRAPMEPGRLHVSIDHPQHGHFEIRHMRDGSDAFRQVVGLENGAAEGDEPTWVQITTRGTFKGHGAGEFSLDDETLSQIVRNYRDVDGGEVSFDFEHASEQPATDGSLPVLGAPAQAWIKDLRIEPTGLFALVKWLEPAKTYIREGKYRFVSPAIRFGARHPVTNKPIGARLTSVALTNQPFLRGLQPLAAKDNAEASTTLSSGKKTMAYSSHELMPKMRECLGMHATATPAQCMETLKALREYHESGDGHDVQGVPVSEYCERLSDALRMPLTATVGEMFDACEKALMAAHEEHTERLSGLEEGGAETMSDTEKKKMADLKDVQDKLTAAEARAVEAEKKIAALELRLKDAGVPATAAEAEKATLTLQLNQKTAKVSELEAEIVRLKADNETKVQAELEARVERAFADHEHEQKLTDKHKSMMLLQAKNDRKAFEELFPLKALTPAAHRHLMTDLTGTKGKLGNGTGGHREPPAKETNAGADAEGDLTVETHAETALRLMKADPTMSIAAAISEASRLRAAGEGR